MSKQSVMFTSDAMETSSPPLNFPNSSSMNGSNETSRQLVYGYTHLYYSETECSVISVILSCLSLIGSSSNICVLVVYLNKQSKCPFEVFVSFLALVNLTGSLVSMPLETAVVWSRGDEVCNSPPDYIMVLTMVLECGSILSLLNIAIDRYFSICWPTHEIITERRARMLCTVVFAFSIALGLVLYATADENLEIHLIYSVSATFALLVIMLLYVLVFLKVRSSASNFKRNRSLASQRSATEVALQNQDDSNRKYKRRGENKAGAASSSSHSSRRFMPWKQSKPMTSLTVESSIPMDKRLSCSTVTADSAMLYESDQTLNNQEPATSKQGNHSAEHVHFESSLVSNEVGPEQPVVVNLNEEHAQPDVPETFQCSSAANPAVLVQGENQKQQGNGRKQRKKRFRRSPFVLRRATTNFERGMHDAMRNRTAKILTIITLCYILCFVPTSIINFIFYVRPDTLQAIPPGVIRLIKYSQLLYFLNFVLSPIVYSLFSEAFRNDFAALQRRIKRKFTI